MDYVCRICANAADNQTFRCTEKMFGFGGEFIYFQCGRCGCLQTKAVPADLSRYYPPHYYSFHLQAVPQRGLKARLAGWRDYWVLSGRGADAWFARRASKRWRSVAAVSTRTVRGLWASGGQDWIESVSSQSTVRWEASKVKPENNPLISRAFAHLHICALADGQ